MVQQNQINDKNLANIESTNTYNSDKRAQTLTNQIAIPTKIVGINKVYTDIWIHKRQMLYTLQPLVQ